MTEALQAGRPVVALESTIITHGMPYPQNLAMARDVAADCRTGGAVPATIGVLGGRILVGMSAAECEELAQEPAPMKLSRADLAFAAALGRSGGTTVSATMIAAARAGIRIFATGGIGGVHRGGESSLDVSADLAELARTPVAVVCAGPKAILDLPRTLEYLETQGVPVIGYRTGQLPAFWSAASPWPLTLRAESAAEIAAVIAGQRALGLENGLLVANPIPAAEEIPFPAMAGWIDRALAEAEAARITGKAVTPFLLDRLLTLTSGRSLAANIALVRNNARLAAAIAVALASAP
ncbi:pseudouridine-5'-phosphate glycosidase [Acidisoma sp. C75]